MKEKELAVFSIVRPSACSECGCELDSGDFLLKEKEDRVLCMECADLDRFLFLPRGNAALSRRAIKHTGLRVVVLRWSRARKRYERQGVLVSEPALERAEKECLADADARKARAEREAVRRAELDQEFVREFGERIRELYPGCPAGEAAKISEHACRKHSGRVGRTAAAKEFQPQAIGLAVAAHVRHAHTDYDDLLARGEDRREARHLIRPVVEEVLARWSRGKAD